PIMRIMVEKCRELCRIDRHGVRMVRQFDNNSRFRSLLQQVAASYNSSAIKFNEQNSTILCHWMAPPSRNLKIFKRAPKTLKCISIKSLKVMLKLVYFRRLFYMQSILRSK